MISRPSRIWIGDLVKAMQAFPDEDVQRLIELLDLAEQRQSSDSEPPEPVAPPPMNLPVADIAVAPGNTKGDPGSDLPANGKLSPNSSDSATDEIPQLSESYREPKPITGWQLQPSLDRVTEERLISPAEATPLLAPRSVAAVLQAVIATPADDGPPDIDALTWACVEARPVLSIPRKKSLTLRFGVELLLDIGEAMELFVNDHHELLRRVRALVGTANSRVTYFADSPIRGAGAGSRRTWRPYEPPHA